MPTDTLSFFPPPSLPLFIKKAHYRRDSYELWALSLRLKTFLTCTNTSYSHTPIKTVHRNKPFSKNFLTTIPQQTVKVSQSLYKRWNIHIHTYFFPSFFFCPFSKKNIFLHFKVCYIYEQGRKCPHGNTVTHPGVLLQWGDEPQTTRSHLLQHAYTNTHMQTHRGGNKKCWREEASVLRKGKMNSHQGSHQHKGGKMFSKWYRIKTAWCLFRDKAEDLPLCLSESFPADSKSEEMGNNNNQQMEISSG